jgi:hypothetical protein
MPVSRLNSGIRMPDFRHVCRACADVVLNLNTLIYSVIRYFKICLLDHDGWHDARAFNRSIRPHQGPNYYPAIGQHDGGAAPRPRRYATQVAPLETGMP